MSEAIELPNLLLQPGAPTLVGCWSQLQSALLHICPSLLNSSCLALLTKLHPLSKLSSHIIKNELMAHSVNDRVNSLAGHLLHYMGAILEASERPAAADIFNATFSLVS